MTMPVKTPIRSRTASLALQALEAQRQKQALVLDPLLKLSEAQPLLGNPSYAQLRAWIANGSLRVWRAGRGHFRVRLSEVQRFLTANEVHLAAR